MKKIIIQLLVLPILLFSCADDPVEDFRLEAVGKYSGRAVHYTTFNNPEQFYHVFEWIGIELTVSASKTKKDELEFKNQNDKVVFRGLNAKTMDQGIVFDITDFVVYDDDNKPVTIEGNQCGYFRETEKMKLNFEYTYAKHHFLTVFTLYKK